MKAKCSMCNQFYDEKDEEQEIFIESGCPMICYDCANKIKEEMFRKYNTSE